MDIFLELLVRLIPLYTLILLGFTVGKLLTVDRNTIATLLIYVIAPVVVFDGVSNTEIQLNVLLLPLFYLTLTSLIGVLSYFFAKRLWSDATKNIFAFTAATGNTGYFGLPVAMMLFEPNDVGIYIFALLGFSLYENSVGFFIVAKGSHTLADSAKKLLTLPTVYAFFAGLAINVLPLHMSGDVQTMITNFRGAYTVLGMMIIGIGLAGLQIKDFDWKFLGTTLLAKFAVWPVITFGIISIDRYFFHVFSQQIYEIMWLLSIVPLAANTVAIATLLKAHPEKSAVAVLVSTLVALVFIPLMVSFI